MADLRGSMTPRAIPSSSGKLMEPMRPRRSGRRTMNAAASTLVLAIAGAAMTSTALAETIAITGVRLIDGAGGPAVANATIVIDNGRIIAVGPNVTLPKGTRRRNGAGRTI